MGFLTLKFDSTPSDAKGVARECAISFWLDNLKYCDTFYKAIFRTEEEK